MRALVLDRQHSVLIDGDRLPALAAGGPRPLRAVTAWFAARGVELPAPAGSRPCSDGGRDFAFVIDRVAAPAGMAWRALRDLAADGALWDLYVALVLGGWQPPTRAVDVWSFGDRPEMAGKLAHLVACGSKRVTMGWVAACEKSGTPLPYLGGVSIVTDGHGFPRVVLRTTGVRVVAFAEIDAESAAGEGEGDLSYDDWREGHVAYFTREAERHGLVFDERSEIAVERFEVLHIVGRADA